MSKDIIVYGGSGHAKVVIDCIEEQGVYNIKYIIENDIQKIGSKLLGYPIISPDELDLSNCYFVVAIGNDEIRKKLYIQLINLGYLPAIIIHPLAYVSKYATVGGGSVVLKGATINACAKVGENIIVNTHSIIEHDCIIGDHSQISPNATICGACNVGEGCYIGAGSIIRQCLNVGDWSYVGMGSNVVKDITANCLVYGNPAKKIKNIRANYE